ncbi:MAG: ribosome-associated protein [Moraxellaceae bacterium]|jgi:ribosome-associated protein|nr:ribosome-associated protein [Moraxellaceae bacterium]
MSLHHPYDDTDDDSSLSKTEQKKAMERLQALGERLGTLGPDQLKKMPISEKLFSALEELKRLKAHEAVRRHKQYIGKLMRDEDEEAILNVLNPLTSPTLNKQLELLIDRLLNQGDPAINDVVRRYPAAERHTLRQHVRAALKEEAVIAEMLQEKRDAAEKPARKKLLMYLREVAALAD